MHPSFTEDLVRERVNELWRLADDANRFHLRELRSHRPARLRPALGRGLISLGSRLITAGRGAATDDHHTAVDCG